MNSSIIQLLILAAIAVFLIVRLRGVLGTRDGFEPPRAPDINGAQKPTFEVIDGGPDPDIIDHVDEKSSAASALGQMKKVEPSFGVGEFLQGSKGAYEMILMAFENGDLSSVRSFLGQDVYEAFAGVVESRADQGLTIDVNFIGVRETTLTNATFNENLKRAEIDVRFVAEITSVVRDRGGDVVEGSETEVKRQRDVWTFARTMGSNDPNWHLVATGE
ncbi:MAG: Tim44/TimA family putative adaptor protein [Planktomarina sp.]